MLKWAQTSKLAILVGTVGCCTMTASSVAAAQDADVVCARRELETQVCTLELVVEQVGHPPTIDAALGDSGGFMPGCDRGSHYNPDPQRAQLNEVPCHHPEYGWYSQVYDCYFLRTEELAADDPGVFVPRGQRPGRPGAVYEGMCYTASLPRIHDNYCFCVPPGWFGVPNFVFLASPPDGYEEGQPDPVPALLVSAINQMALQAPTIGTAPPAGQGSGLVNAPVWLWNEVSGNNWGSLSATAGPVAGISVVADARATRIDWDLGDGHGVTCDEGVAWERGMNVLDPPCGYRYQRASRHEPDGVYRISASTTWVLEWRTEGLATEEGGEFELQATSTTTLQIDEIQVLVQ